MAGHVLLFTKCLDTCALCEARVLNCFLVAEVLECQSKQRREVRGRKVAILRGKKRGEFVFLMVVRSVLRRVNYAQWPGGCLHVVASMAFTCVNVKCDSHCCSGVMKVCSRVHLNTNV